MELHVNNEWTAGSANSYVAEPIAWSENGNHAAIYVMGNTAEEADAKLMRALQELNLTPKTSGEVQH